MNIHSIQYFVQSFDKIRNNITLPIFSACEVLFRPRTNGRPELFLADSGHQPTIITNINPLYWCQDNITLEL